MPNLDSYKKIINLKTAITVVYSTVVALAVINLIGTNTLATQGMKLDKIHQEINEINKYNQKAEIEISQTTNLEKIDSLAHNLGYVRTQQVYQLNAESTVAYIGSATHE